MDFLTALNLSKNEGCSITRTKYLQYLNTENENTNQWYFDDKGRLVRQEYNYEPRVATVQHTAWDDDWCVYKGRYKQSYKRIAEEKAELLELEEELKPLIAKMDRLKYLRNKYGESNNGNN